MSALRKAAKHATIAATILLTFTAISVLIAKCYFNRTLEHFKWEKDTLDKYAQLGQFGDYFGGVLNPVVGFVTICLLVLTIWLQASELRSSADREDENREFNKEQLENAKKQLEQSDAAHRELIERSNRELHASEQARKEELAIAAQQAADAQRERFEAEQARIESLKAAREQNEKQLEALNRQRFEQTFFSWLESSRNIVRDFHVEDEASLERSAFSGIHGMEAIFDRAYSPLYMTFSEKASLHILTRTEDRSKLNSLDEAVCASLLAKWENIYRQCVGQLDPMFRTLYRLLRWIDEHKDLSIEEKVLYVSIVRAHVSFSEYKYLLLNGFTSRGKNMVFLMNKYAFFDNLEQDNGVIDMLRTSSKSPYKPSAFSSKLARDELGIIS
jgi:uncharacterized membrane protein